MPGSNWDLSMQGCYTPSPGAVHHLETSAMPGHHNPTSAHQRAQNPWATEGEPWLSHNQQPHPPHPHHGQQHEANSWASPVSDNHHHHHGRDDMTYVAGPGASPEPGQAHWQPPSGVVHVAPPRIEAQPWAKNVWGWLRSNSTGVARVDLRRPTPPPPDMYAPNNILMMQRQTVPPGSNPTGARVKITRNFIFGKHPDGRSKPLLDFGIGASVEMDRATLEPVARLKIKNLVSIKAFPNAMVKVAGSVPLGPTGMTAKIVYELPFNNISSFWTPPARLMVRLDNASNSGLHLSPTGIEFDEKFVQLGSRLAVRAALGLQFPRSLPVDLDNDHFGFKVHRLSLKSLW